MDHPLPGLRYVDAGELDGGAFEFDGLDVESNTGDTLGTVDGVILDVASARPRYVVVNAGGWFTSKFFLLPIGHAGLDVARRKLIADVSKDHVRKYPGFDRDEFEKLSPADLDRMDRQFAVASWPDWPAEAGTGADNADFQRRYQEWKRNQDATWWDSSYYDPARFDSAARAVAAGTAAASTSSRDEELVTARERDLRDTTVGDVSPHFAGRAQPGDVLGVETGGERTYIGDTTDDENERREDAEKAAVKQRE